MLSTHRLLSTIRLPEFLLAIFFLLATPASAVEPEPHCPGDTEDAIRIAVLFPASPTGSKHRSGIYRARDDFVKKNPGFEDKIYLEKFIYLNEDDGVQKLKQLYRPDSGDSKCKFHAILGPTESGVFVKGLEQLSAEPEEGIPVISPLVIAKAGNTYDGWFFRLNVDIETRSEKIFDFLNRKGFKNIAVLYADGTLGTRSEETFSRLFSESKKENYSSAAYGRQREEIRPNLVKVLEKRPGAIGVFGQRSDIEYIARRIRGMDKGWSQYTPALFTNIDASQLQMEDLYFITLRNLEEQPKQYGGELEAPPEKDPKYIDDVYGLAYDTAAMVFNLIRNNELTAKSQKNLPRELRNHLVNYLDGPSDARMAGKYTKMKFDNFDNQAELWVLAYEKNQGIYLDKSVHYDAGFEWLDKSKNWISILIRRFGYTPFWNVLLVVLTGILINLVDLTKLYGVPVSYMRRTEFLQLIGLNVAIALAVYFFMSFTGLLSWNDTWGAILVVATYTVILKANILGSENAKAIGLADFYNRIVKAKHDKIMIAMLHKEGKTINYIAYANTLVYLQKVLFEIYDFTEKEQAKELKEKLKKELEAVQGLVDKRKVCANRIHEKLTWAELQEKRLVPYEISEKEIEEKLFDPLVLVRVGADYCIPLYSYAKIEQVVREDLKSIINREKGDEKEKNFDAELKGTLSQRAAFETCLLWLYIHYGFNTQRLVADNYLPADFEKRITDPTSVVGQEQERRRHERAPLDLAVDCVQFAANDESDNRVVSAELRNLSLGGARLNMLNCDTGNLSKETEIAVEIHEEKAGKLALTGTVVYLNKGRNANTIGIRWEQLSEEIAANLNLLLPST